MKIMKENKVLTSEALNAEMILSENIRKENEIKRETKYDEMVVATSESVTATQESIAATEHSIEVTTDVETKLANGEFDGKSGVWVGDTAPIEDDYNVWIDPQAVDGTFSTVATTGSYNDLKDKPTSLPANGGNADTVGGKSASDFATSIHKHTKADISDFPTSIPAEGGDADTLGGLSPDDLVQTEQIANRLDVVEAGYVLDGRQGKALDDKIKVNSDELSKLSKIEALPATVTLASLLNIVGLEESRRFKYVTDALPSDYPADMISSGHVFMPIVTVHKVANGLIYLEITSPNTSTGLPKTITGYYNGSFYWNSDVTKADIANNFVTTQEGFVADARTVKTLKDSVDGLNNNLTKKFITVANGTFGTVALPHCYRIGDAITLQLDVNNITTTYGGWIHVGTLPLTEVPFNGVSCSCFDVALWTLHPVNIESTGRIMINIPGAVSNKSVRIGGSYVI